MDLGEMLTQLEHRPEASLGFNKTNTKTVLIGGYKI
jgi:hypothetical protein